MKATARIRAQAGALYAARVAPLQLTSNKTGRRVRELISHIGLISEVIPFKLFPDYSGLQKCQEGLEIAKPVTRSLLVLHAFPPGGGTPL